MSDNIKNQSNIAMLGDGFYSRVSLGPKAVIDNCKPLLMQALDQVLDHSNALLKDKTNTDNETSSLTIADFGAADGGTSLELIGTLVNKARSLDSRRSINIVYTDLPDADFGTLFRLVNNEIPGQPGYLHNMKNVHVFSSGMSFYTQILPSNSLALGFSASAMHYLSRMPAIINDHIHAVGASKYEQEEYRAVANSDWQQILIQRSKELAIGGQLVMANFCIDDKGHYLGNTGGQNLFENYNRLWKAMCHDGVITDGEYRNTAFQQYYKSIEDSLLPLTDESNDVYQSGLRLVTAATETIACPFRTAFENGSLSESDFAQQFVNTHRSWTETTFRAGLDESRTSVEKQTILDELYERFRQLVLDNPVGHGKDLLHLYIVAKKQN